MKLLVPAFLFLALGYLATAEVLPPPFQKCSNFFLKNQPPTGPLGNQYMEICQKRDPAAGYEFATLYDTNLRIPIYSAYEFQSKGSCSRNTPWYIEPQLDDPTKGPEMNTQGTVTKPPRGDNQALNDDYDGSGYHRGHLVPVYHRNAKQCIDATFTLTNAAPQYPKFNSGAWRVAEATVAKKLDTDCLNRGFKAYIITGVVPGNNPPIKGRVNIPDYFWSTYCCVDNNNVPKLSGAFYGKNDITNKVTTTTVANLNAWLGFSVFGNNC
ncbi:endonuclease domain-containing 1 protein-like [Scomber scombrus]|uniref:endonuclease domain-containing 1 protein-like n=1 Tax=Scomber scombrus TaxID=13677 RepID=UPI002DDB3604|nr:endonuclease domain-containing 1 protein-like [Scomber scombrus]